MKNLTWQNPEQLFVAQVLINKVKSKCCGIKAYKVNHYYEHFTPNSKLVKEIVVDTRNLDCYRTFGIYKKVYKRYNYNYQDSVYYSYCQDSLMIEYWVNENKDTVCIHYINLNKAK